MTKISAPASASHGTLIHCVQSLSTTWPLSLNESENGELLKKCYKSTNHLVFRDNSITINLTLYLFFGTKAFTKHNVPLEVNKC